MVLLITRVIVVVMIFLGVWTVDVLVVFLDEQDVQDARLKQDDAQCSEEKREDGQIVRVAFRAGLAGGLLKECVDGDQLNLC